MACGINFHWMYRSMIDEKLKNKQLILNKSNQKAVQIQEYPTEAPKYSSKEPEENKILRNPTQGCYSLKEKHVYYFSPTFLYNSPSPTEMVNIYTALRNNRNGKTKSPVIDNDLKTISTEDPQQESVQQEAKFKDLKMNHRFILSHGDYSTNYRNITEKGVEVIENCDENTKSETGFIHRVLSVLRPNYTIPDLVSEDYAYENTPNAPDGKVEIDVCGTKKEPSLNPEIPFPQVTSPSPEENIEPWSCYAKPSMDQIDDETYEFLSLFEDDCNDIKERPRDDILKGRFLDKFGFETSHPLEKSFDNAAPVTGPPRHFSTLNPCSNRVDFRSRLEASDESLSDEGFFVDPIFRDVDVNRQKDSAEVGVPEVRKKRELGFVSFVKSLFEDGKSIHKFVKS